MWRVGKIAVVVAVVMLVGMQETNAARILMAVPICTRSHHNFFMPLAEHLAQRNHTVTYLSSYEFSERQPNLHVVHVADTQIFNKLSNLFTTDIHTALSSIYDDMKTVCLQVLSYEEVQNLRKEKFDLIILHYALTECFLSFAHDQKIPFIHVNPNRIIGGVTPLTGSPAFPSLSANFLLDLQYPLTFFGRMVSTLYDIITLVYTDWIYFPSMESNCRARHLCSKNMSSLNEIRIKNSLFITNSVRTLENPTLPYTPTVVHAGGIHCRPAKSLSEDLQQWINEAGRHGFIYFSLGSFIKPSTMPEKYRKILVEVFGSLQQRVLWKWDEDTMEDLPSNVRLSKWLPQQDILGHPQLRLFITHGGLFSTQEATYHGVPILGIPVSIDQHHNMRMVQQEGWGRVLFWEELTYDRLRSDILHLMHDPGVKEQVKWRSKVMRDAPMSPGDWATYWIEYVLRHQGAAHLRSPAVDIPWYQLYNVDVWAFLVTVMVTTCILLSWLSYKVLLTLTNYCCGSKKKKD